MEEWSLLHAEGALIPAAYTIAIADNLHCRQQTASRAMSAAIEICRIDGVLAIVIPLRSRAPNVLS